MNNFKKMMDRIEDVLSAVSFAEEGDFQSARELLKQQRRVLLALRARRLDENTLKYALNSCRRIGADLDILYVSAAAPDSGFEHFLARLEEEGITARLIAKEGCLKQAIIDYTTEKREVLFVVIESSRTLDVDCSGRGKRLSESWKNLKCPLVVVSEAKA